MSNETELENLELKISKFLRYGVLVSGFFLAIGWISNFSLTENPYEHFKFYDYLPLQDILQLYFRNKEWGVLISYVGLGLLISLPLIRVLLTAFLFIKQKEYQLAAIATLVLICLVVSFSFGIDL